MRDMPLDARTEEDRPAPRRRPLAPVLAGAVLGIAVDGAATPPTWFWWAVGAAAVAGALWALRGRRARWAYSVLVVLMLAPVGGAYHALRFRARPARHVENLRIGEGGLYRVRGRVRHEPRYRHRRNPFHPEAPMPGHWLLRVAMQELRGEGEWQSAAGGLTVLVDAEPPHVGTGDVVEFVCRLSTGSPPTNPGQRDAVLSARRRGDDALAVVRDGRTFRLLRPAPRYSPTAAVGRLRTLLRRRMGEPLPDDGRENEGLLASLLFGDRGALRPLERDLLAESGTLHFLAISGLHVGIFCLIVVEVLRWTGLAVWWRHMAAIALVWAYVLFTGSLTPAVRAGGMLTFLLAAPLLHRGHDALSALMGAALMTLLLAPQQLFSAGFQLTFVAVWGLLVVYPRLREVVWPWQGFLERVREPSEVGLLRDLGGRTRNYVLLSFTVWLVTAPLLAWHFNRVSFLVPLLNLVLWPLVALLLVLGFIILALLLVPVGLIVTPLLALALWIGGYIRVFLLAARRLPGYGVYLPAPPMWWVGLFFAAVGVWVMRRRVWRGQPVFILVVLVLGLSYVWQDAAVRMRREFRMVVADVGHGQSLVLGLPGGETLLFDAGSSNPRAAERVASILWQDRVERISAVLISHYHSDHCVFLPHLAERFRIARAVLPGVPSPPPLGESVHDLLSERRVREHKVAEGAVFAGGGLACRVLHPDRQFAFSEGVSENDRSLVVRGSYQGFTFLLPGDIEERAMARLVRDYGDALRSDLLILPHHGQYHEGLGAFLDAVSPRAAVASDCGECFGPRTERALYERGIPVWVTARDGAVIVTLPAEGMRIEGYASGRAETFEPGSPEEAPEWTYVLSAE